MPIAIALRSVPLVAMTPFLMLIFGRGAVGVSVVVGIVVFFPTLGERHSRDAHGTRTGGRHGLLLRWVYDDGDPQGPLPVCLAGAVRLCPDRGACRLAGATLAEWLATGRGLGNLIVVSYTNSQFNTLWAATVVIVAVAVMVYALVGMLEVVVRSRFGPAPESD